MQNKEGLIRFKSKKKALDLRFNAFFVFKFHFCKDKKNKLLG